MSKYVARKQKLGCTEKLYGNAFPETLLMIKIFNTSTLN